MITVISPFPQYFDLDGSPLDDGRVYFGVVGKNPETDPVTVYWDQAGTQPAAQPIRTLNGYPVRGNAPTPIFVADTYSVTVRDKRGRLVYTAISPFGSGTAQSEFLSLQMTKTIELTGVQPAAIVPRLGGFGAGPFTVGVLVQANTFVNSPGIFGGLAGSLNMRFDASGFVKVGQTSVVDITTSATRVAVGEVAFLMWSRDNAGNNTLSINGVAVASFVNNASYYGENAFLGSPNGVDAVLDGNIAQAFATPQSMSLTDAQAIMARGLTLTQMQGAYFVMGDTHAGSPLVIPSACGAIDNYPGLIKPTVVLPATARVRSYPQKPPLITYTPRVGPGYFIGDSQTFQFNASGSPIYTDTATTVLKVPYQWTYKYCKLNNRDIQENNYAITGSGFQYIPGQPYTVSSPAWNPHFYAMGRIPPEWYGQIVMVPGWNNIGTADYSLDAARNFRRAAEALVAKALCRYYGGLGINGLYGNNYGGGAPITGFSTTGTNGDVTADAFGTPLNYLSNPFPCYGTGDNNKIRKILLAPGQFVEWTVLAVGKNGRYAIYTEANTAGGDYEVRLNGAAIISDNNLTSQPGSWSQVNWIERPTPGQQMRVHNTGTGTVVFLATSWDIPEELGALDRQVILCSTTGNLTGRTPFNLQLTARLAEQAAMTFGDMGVKFVNLAMGWQQGDQDAQDPPHISPQGTDRIANTIPTARAVPHFLPAWCVRI